MKRKVLSILAIAAVAFTSCKKDELDTTELGSATISGNVWADLDQTDDTDVNGLYIAALNPEGVGGMQVTVEVNTMDWDQNPVTGFDYAKKVYTTTTDASGNYTLTIPATDDGYSIDIQFGDIFTTRTIYATDGVSILTEDVRIDLADQTEFIYSGAALNVKDQAVVSLVNNSANEYGWATVSGDIFVSYDIANWNTPAPANQKWNTASGLPAHDIIYTYFDAPYGNGGPNVFIMAIDLATGTYTLTVATEAAGGNSVEIDFGGYDIIGSQIMNNNSGTADSTRQVVYSFGGIDNFSQVLSAGDIIANYDLGVSFSSL